MDTHGRLEAFFETGTEGVLWSVINPSLPGYDGLQTLNNGDRLRVIGKQDETLWEGVIDLEYTSNWQPYGDDNDMGQQAVQGFWVHGLQADMAPDAWADMFFERYRAVLLDREQKHPFVGPSSQMGARLRALPETDQHELYRTALYSWLYFFSTGEFSSHAKDWGFTLDETVRLIGSPTEAQVAAWKTYPKTYGAVLIPFDMDVFIRVALLFGVYGALDWKFHDKADVVTWLNDAHGNVTPKQMLLGSIDEIVAVRDVLMINKDG